MSAELAVRAAMLAALRGDTVLAGLVNGISDSAPVKASAPWLLVGDPVATGWGARGVDGLSLRQPMTLLLRGDDPSAAAAILDRIDILLRAMPATMGDWRVTSLRLERSRIGRSADGWRANVDYMLRLARLV